MTHKTVPVEPTYRYLKDGETIMSADEVLAYGEDWELIGEHMVGLDFDEVDNWPIRRKVEAAPPSPVTELEAMLADACIAMVEWDAREKDHSIDFYARIELCNLAFEKARQALAAYEAKKGGK